MMAFPPTLDSCNPNACCAPYLLPSQGGVSIKTIQAFISHPLRDCFLRFPRSLSNNISSYSILSFYLSHFYPHQQLQTLMASSSNLVPASRMKQRPAYPWLPEPPRRLLLNADLDPELSKAISMTLAGKIIGSTEYDEKEIKGDLVYAWKPKCMVNFLKVAKFVVSVKFCHTADKKMVLDGGPWFVNKDLIVFTEASEDSSISDCVFKLSKFWVRVNHIPLKSQTKDLSDWVGNLFEGVVEYDLPKVSEEDKEGSSAFLMKQSKDYLRVKVLVDITKGLHPVLPLNIEKKDKTAVSSIDAKLSYEALPEFCYLCGIIGHKFKFCLHFEEGMTMEDLPFDDSLRATKVNINKPWAKDLRASKVKRNGGVSSTDVTTSSKSVKLDPIPENPKNKDHEIVSADNMPKTTSTVQSFHTPAGTNVPLTTPCSTANALSLTLFHKAGGPILQPRIRHI